MNTKKLYCIWSLLLISLIGFAQVTEYTVTTTGEKIKIDLSVKSNSTRPNYTESGRTIVNNQGVYFGWFMSGATEKVEARISLWKGDNLAQIGEPFEFQINKGALNGYRVPMYINVPAGTYKLKPMLRQLDKDYWTVPEDYSDYGDNYTDMLSYKNWEYQIKDISTHKTPSILMLCSEGLSDELVGGNGIPTLFNQPEERDRYERFDVFVRLSNKTNATKKGKIKIMWERDFDKFWLGYSKSADVMTNWSKSITKGATMNGITDWDDTGLPIEIPANTKDIRFDIKGCYASEYYNWGTTYTPYTHCYFQPEGSSEWILCGLDASDEFNAQHEVIPSVYQKNCNSFALWITDATDNSVASNKETTTYDWTAKTLTISNVPDRSYVFMYDLDGKRVKAEPTVTDGNYTFSTAAIAPGAYLLKIISGTAVRTIKLTL